MAECCSTTFPPRVAVLILGIVNMMRYCAMIMLWVCVQLLSCVQLFETLWTVTHQAPLSLGFSRQEYLSGLPWPSPGDLPDPGNKPGSPALQANALRLSHQSFTLTLNFAPNKCKHTIVLKSTKYFCMSIPLNPCHSVVSNKQEGLLKMREPWNNHFKHGHSSCSHIFPFADSLFFTQF